MIPVSNIYYMLSYCFRALQSDDFKKMGTEEFDNSADLCAAILEKGIEYQLKRGLGRQYIPQTEPLSTLHGKINISESLKTQSLLKMQLVCDYDEFSVDFQMNRIIKTTVLYLLASDISKKRKQALRKLLPFLDEISVLDLHAIDWNFRYDRSNQTYRILMFICRLVIDGLLQSENSDGERLPTFIDDQSVSRLYEHFVLEYYKQEHKGLLVSAPQVAWDVDDGFTDWLPIMQTDITLRDNTNTLIIDTKYYSSTMQEQYGVKTVHSGNLYQLFSYVKNQQASLDPAEPPVSGMLLYAKTDEQLVPDFKYSIGGNSFEVRTLDLSGDFASIREQLDGIAEQYFPEVGSARVCVGK